MSAHADKREVDLLDRRFGSSSISSKLRPIRNAAHGDVARGIAAATAFTATAVAAVLGTLGFAIMTSLFNTEDIVNFSLAFVLLATIIALTGLRCAQVVSRHSWNRFQSDYQRAMTALHATDLAMVIADDGLRADAYARTELPMPPKWLQSTQEPMERHVQRAAWYFDRLLAYSDGGRQSRYWYRRGCREMPPRTALIALTDFLLGNDTRYLNGWRCLLMEKAALLVSVPDIPASQLMTPLHSTDLGGQLRLEAQRQRENT